MCFQKNANLNLFRDTAGQERFNSITTAYYRNAKGIVLMYDVTRPESYLNISKWLDLIQEVSASRKIVIQKKS